MTHSYVEDINGQALKQICGMRACRLDSQGIDPMHSAGPLAQGRATLLRLLRDSKGLEMLLALVGSSLGAWIQCCLYNAMHHGKSLCIRCVGGLPTS